MVLTTPKRSLTCIEVMHLQYLFFSNVFLPSLFSLSELLTQTDIVSYFESCAGKRTLTRM